MAELDRTPNPAGSPNEKLITQNPLEQIENHVRGKLAEGPVTNEELVEVFRFYNEKIQYELGKQNRNLELWANVHTHPGGSGGVGGVWPEPGVYYSAGGTLHAFSSDGSLLYSVGGGGVGSLHVLLDRVGEGYLFEDTNDGASGGFLRNPSDGSIVSELPDLPNLGGPRSFTQRPGDGRIAFGAINIRGLGIYAPDGTLLNEEPSSDGGVASNVRKVMWLPDGTLGVCTDRRVSSGRIHADENGVVLGSASGSGDSWDMARMAGSSAIVLDTGTAGDFTEGATHTLTGYESILSGVAGWSHTAPGPCRLGTGKYVVVGTDDGEVWSLNAVTGEKRWVVVPDGTSIRVVGGDANGHAYAVTENGHMYAYDVSGVEKWSYTASSLGVPAWYYCHGSIETEHGDVAFYE